MSAEPETFRPEVERAIERRLAGEGLSLELGRALAFAPHAKRARPLLCAALAEAVDVRGAALVEVAAAVELIHTASLLHDDVVDEAASRRGQPTANRTAGNVRAVLGGDHVLMRALTGLAQLEHGPALTEAALTCVESMTRAALLEVGARGNARFALESWRAMAAGKTGALFELCGRAIGILGASPERAARFGAACAALGLAFQIADDLGDLIGGRGKPTRTDLLQKNPSFVTAWASRQSPAFARRLESVWAARRPSPRAAAELAAEAVGLGVAQAAHEALVRELDDARRLFAEDAGHPAIEGVLATARALAGELAGSPGLARAALRVPGHDRAEVTP